MQRSRRASWIDGVRVRCWPAASPFASFCGCSRQRCSWAGVTGLFQFTGPSQPDRVAQKSALGASVASIVQQAAEQSHGALVAIGVVLTLYTSMSLIRALRVAYVLAWEEPVGRCPRAVRDGAIVSAAPLLGLATQTAIKYLRDEVGLARWCSAWARTWWRDRHTVPARRTARDEHGVQVAARLRT
jgi:hypothetical protein